MKSGGYKDILRTNEGLSIKQIYNNLRLQLAL